MVIKEPGDITNYPVVLGRKNIPYTILRGQPLLSRLPIPIGKQAMALVRGETPIHLAQKLRAQIPRGTGLITGTARRGLERGMGKPLTAIQRAARHKRLYGQIRTFLTRPAPIMNLLKITFPLAGQALGVNIPAAYERPGTWPTGARIGELPAVKGIIEGPESTVHPKSLSVSALS